MSLLAHIQVGAARIYRRMDGDKGKPPMFTMDSANSPTLLPIVWQIAIGGALMVERERVGIFGEAVAGSLNR
jgi:hypothetical protein